MSPDTSEPAARPTSRRRRARAAALNSAAHAAVERRVNEELYGELAGYAGFFANNPCYIRPTPRRVSRDEVHLLTRPYFDSRLNVQPPRRGQNSRQRHRNNRNHRRDEHAADGPAGRAPAAAVPIPVPAPAVEHGQQPDEDEPVVVNEIQAPEHVSELKKLRDAVSYLQEQNRSIHAKLDEATELLMQISSSLRRPCSPYPQPPAIIRTPPPSPARASPPPGADRASIVLERGPMTPPSPINYSRDEDELTFNQNEEPDHGYNDTVRDLLG